MAATFKPAYLIHGDDHGRIAERRARLRALAERDSGAHGVEVFEGEAGIPDEVAAALNAMTLAIGRRFIVVDGVERWKDKELDQLVAALAAIAPDTTVAFFAREEGRMKAPGRLHEAVTKAGGDIAAENSVKPWELPGWVVMRGRELGLELAPDAARALIAHVGDRQQRLLRELEKLALDLIPPSAAADSRVSVDVECVEQAAAPSAERRAWSLADELVAGERAPAVRLLLQTRAQGERLSGLIYWMGARVREAHRVAEALDAGQPPAQLKRTLRMPARAADRLIGDASRAGSERLRAAVGRIADLELASRGGGSGGASEDTAALLTVLEITGER